MSSLSAIKAAACLQTREFSRTSLELSSAKEKKKKLGGEKKAIKVIYCVLLFMWLPSFPLQPSPLTVEVDCAWKWMRAVNGGG